MACKVIKFVDGSYISVLRSDEMGIGSFDYTVLNAAFSYEKNDERVTAWQGEKTDLDGNVWNLSNTELTINNEIVCLLNHSNSCASIHYDSERSKLNFYEYYTFPDSVDYSNVYWYGHYLDDIDSLSQSIRDYYNEYSNFYGCNMFYGGGGIHLVVSCKNSDLTYGFTSTRFTARMGSGHSLDLSKFQNSYDDAPTPGSVSIPVQWRSTRYEKTYQDTFEIVVTP